MKVTEKDRDLAQTWLHHGPDVLRQVIHLSALCLSFSSVYWVLRKRKWLWSSWLIIWHHFQQRRMFEIDGSLLHSYDSQLHFFFVHRKGRWKLRNRSAPWLPRQPAELVLKYQLSATGGPWKRFWTGCWGSQAHHGSRHTLVNTGKEEQGENDGLSYHSP